MILGNIIYSWYITNWLSFLNARFPMGWEHFLGWHSSSSMLCTINQPTGMKKMRPAVTYDFYLETETRYKVKGQNEAAPLLKE